MFGKRVVNSAELSCIFHIFYCLEELEEII
jgi:hypothetical protein